LLDLQYFQSFNKATGLKTMEKEQEYAYKKLEIPKDEEGYVVTFDKDDVVNWKEFFDKYGIVVIRNIISDEDADKTSEEVWDMLLKNNSIKKDDPSTWLSWPWGKHLGILGNAPILSPQACANRENPDVYKFFCDLFGEKELYVSIDRIGMMRPTRGVKFPDKEQPEDKPEWKSVSDWLHWDMNPWTGKTSTYAWQGNDPEQPENKGFDRLMVQGILGLYNCGPNEGGLQGVPGFHKHIQSWANKNIGLKEPRVFPNLLDETTCQVPNDDPIRNDIQKLPIRKGSLLIWHSAIPHGTFPNDSNKFRMIQYMKMAPASYPFITPYFKSGKMYEPDLKEVENVHLTQLGKKLFALKDWKDADENCVIQ